MRGPARSARTGTAVTAALTIGSGAHLGAGGGWSASAVLVAALLLAGPTWLLSRYEQRWWGIAALLLGGQLVVHWTQSGMPRPFRPSPHPHAAMAEPAVGLLPSWSMLAGHLVAALLVGWWLSRGERLLWQAARRAASSVAEAFRRLLHPCCDALCRLVATVPAARSTRRQPRSTVLRHVIVLRGPPAP